LTNGRLADHVCTGAETDVRRAKNSVPQMDSSHVDRANRPNTWAHGAEVKNCKMPYSCKRRLIRRRPPTSWCTPGSV